MVIFFVPQELPGFKVMLPNRIDRYIVQVVAVLAHFSEHCIVLLRQAADNIRLRQVHMEFTSSIIYHQHCNRRKGLR